MKTVTPHGKLLSLLCCLLALAGVSLAALTLSAPQAVAKAPAAEAFGRIVPGMTRAEDLPALGFDALHAQALPVAAVARRFAGDAAARDCVQARDFCTGYLFHPAPQSDIVFLVMGGRVVHKVFRARV